MNLSISQFPVLYNVGETGNVVITLEGANGGPGDEK